MAIILKKLKSEMEKLIDQGVKTFISGGAIGFDSIAASMVIVMKEQPLLSYAVKLTTV